MLIPCIKTELVMVQEEKDASGQPGWRVIHADAWSEWISAAQFARQYRRLDRHEQRVLEMTSGEAAITSISDGQIDLYDDAVNVTEEADPAITPGKPEDWENDDPPASE